MVTKQVVLLMAMLLACLAAAHPLDGSDDTPPSVKSDEVAALKPEAREEPAVAQVSLCRHLSILLQMMYCRNVDLWVKDSKEKKKFLASLSTNLRTFCDGRLSSEVYEDLESSSECSRVTRSQCIGYCSASFYLNVPSANTKRQIVF